MFLVTGHNRTGTNMMFRMLTAGGVPPMHGAVDLSFGSDSYHPNPDGYHEYRGEKLINGGVFKCNNPHDYGNLEYGGVSAIVMLRDYIEVNMSLSKTFGAVRGNISKEEFLSHYDSIYEFLDRRGCGYIVINYGDVLRDPHTQIHRLQNFGVPVTAPEATRVVNPTLYRNKAA